ncbi:MAG: DUF4142 domain-containing protein [Isosphaeraceae bacterium]
MPATLDVCAQYCTQTLMRLSGDKFDQCYAKAQCLAHEGAIAAYEAEAENGQSEELREFARRNLPTLKKHLKTIKSVAHKYEKDDKSSDDHASSDRKSSRDEKVDKTSGRDR